MKKSSLLGTTSAHPGRLSRRAALLLPLVALAGCSAFDYISDTFDDWFGSTKKKLPGTREPVLLARYAPGVDGTDSRPIILPPPVDNADWQQSGCNTTHDIGNPAAPTHFNVAWKADIGEGGGYRARLTAQPIVAAGHVYTMDSDAVVSAFDLANGAHLWSTPTKDENSRSSNIGGGVCFGDGMIYASTGRGDLLALNAADGTIKWRQSIRIPARSAPTYANGKLFLQTADDRLWAASAENGTPLWSYQSQPLQTALLGVPAPAVTDGIVIGGFTSGEIAAVQENTGQPLWSESLVASLGRDSVADLPCVHGLITVDRGRVYAISMAGLIACFDLRSGRRLWRKELSGINWPWLAGDWLFVLSIDQQLYALNHNDGGMRWRSDLPRWEKPDKQRDPITWTGPVLAGERLILVSSTGSAIAINPITGEVLGTQELSDNTNVLPVVASNTVLILADDGTLLALR